MGSYKWGYKSPKMGYNYSHPTYNRTYIITTHEPPSIEALQGLYTGVMSDFDAWGFGL